MPWSQDTRCGHFMIELNANSVLEYLQEKLDCEYNGEPPVEGSKIWNYVCCLEGKVNDNVREYPDEMKQYGIWGYIDDYYDEIDAWDDVKEFFIGDYGVTDVKEEEEENKCEPDRCDAVGLCSLDKCYYESEEEEEIEGEIILVKPQEIKKPKEKKKPSMMPSTPEGWARFIKQTENL